MISSDQGRPITVRCILCILLLLFPAMSLAQQSGQPQAGPAAFSQQARQQLDALRLEKISRTPGQRKIDSNLLLAARKATNQQLPTGFPLVGSTVTTDSNGQTLVDINAKVTDTLLARITVLDGEVVSSFPQYDAIRARLPVTQLETLADEAAVRSIRPAIKPRTHKIDTSQGDVAHRAASARTAYGADGSGVKIGVISDSVESLASLLSSGDLPAVTVLPGQDGSGSSEGTAMLEIVHDLAPGASLYFATAMNGEADFANNILALHQAGCQVIVDDVIYLDEPVFQDGIIAQAVETVCADGAVYFSSAGNEGNKNDGTSGVWEGDFSPGTTPAVISGYGIAHDFGSGATSNTLSGDAGYVTLQWSDPWGGSANDYDLVLLNSTLTSVLAYSNYRQDGDDDPIEAIDAGPFYNTGARLVVLKYSGANRYLNLNTIGGQLAISTAGQIWGHTAAASAFSVAAVRASTAGGGAFSGGVSNPVEFFSSDGPRRVFFSSNGTAITPGDYSSTGGAARPKPDIAAADGVSTATPGFNPFYGTSAAAPHAAAIAALLWSEQPSLTPGQIRTILTSTALDIEAPGVDRDSGAGILDAFAALSATAPAISAVTATNIDGSYAAGSLISIQIAWGTTVTVTGMPVLALNTTPARSANYASGTGSNTLTFTYTVQDGDRCSRLDYASTTALIPSGGTIRNAGGINADLTLPAPGLSGSLAAVHNITIDAVAPAVVSISSPSPASAAGGPVSYTISFTEPVIGFNAGSDVQVNATGTAAAGSVGVSGTGAGPYSVTLSDVTGDGTLTISVKAAACADAAGNTNPASSASPTCAVDNTAPAVTAISSASIGETSDGPVSYTVSFSEPVIGFGSGEDIQIDGTGTVMVASVTVSGSGSGPYTVTLAGITGSGTLGLAINAGVSSDAAGNVNTASSSSTTCIVDNMAPAVSMIGSPSVAHTTVGPVSYTVTFSEPVTGFDSYEDIQIDATGTVMAARGTVSGSDSGPYTVILSGISGTGTLGITVKAGACVDAVGNPNTASLPSAVFTVSRPNLRFAQPTGWTARLIISTQEGTSTSDLDETATVYSSSTRLQGYLDFAVENAGATIETEPTPVHIYLDGERIATRSIEPPFASGSVREILDVPIEITMGNHVLRLLADDENLIAEDDESDNAMTENFSAVQTQVLDERAPTPARGLCGAGAVESSLAMSLALAFVLVAPGHRHARTSGRR